MLDRIYKFNDFADLRGVTIRGVDIPGDSLARGAVRILGTRQARDSLSPDFDT